MGFWDAFAESYIKTWKTATTALGEGLGSVLPIVILLALSLLAVLGLLALIIILF
jgi:hypothetical protein